MELVTNVGVPGFYVATVASRPVVGVANRASDELLEPDVARTQAKQQSGR